MKRIASRRRCYILATVCTIACFLVSTPLFGQWVSSTGTWKGQSIRFVKGELHVKLRGGFSIEDLHRISNCPLPSRSIALVTRGWTKLEYSGDVDILQIADSLERSGLFEEVEPNYICTLSETLPNDSYFASHQWSLKNTGQPPNSVVGADIDANRAWDITIGSSSIIVAVLDTGIPVTSGGQLSHPDLDDAQKIILGDDFTSEGDDIVRDNNGHGTHVSGIIAAETNNSTGVAGVAWGSRLLAIQIATPNGDWTPEAVQDGIDYAKNHGARVINMSFNSRTYQPLVVAAIAQAPDQLFVVSAGNDDGKDPEEVHFPANLSSSYSNVVAVSSTDHRDAFSSQFSMHGPEVNVSAPGGYGSSLDANDIYSTFPDYYVGRALSYGYDYGTSMAAPHVAGVAALVLSVNPNLSPSTVRQILEHGVDDLGSPGKDNYYGWGRINAYKALKYTLEHYGGTVSGNLTIPSGETWNLSSGITWNFAGNLKLRVEGTLVANGVTFTRSDGQWHGIEFYSGNSGSSLYNCTIQNALYGVYVYNTNPTISHSTIRNNGTGIYGSYFYNPSVDWNLIEDNTYGVSCNQYSDLNISPSNIIRYNGWAVSADGSSAPCLGSSTGYNSIYWNDYYDIYSSYSGTIYALGNWWGDYPPYPSIVGDVDYSSALFPQGRYDRILRNSEGIVNAPGDDCRAGCSLKAADHFSKRSLFVSTYDPACIL